LDTDEKEELYADLKKLGQFAAETLKPHPAAEKIS
jgi:hypothetical protein